MKSIGLDLQVKSVEFNNIVLGDSLFQGLTWASDIRPEQSKVCSREVILALLNS